MTDELDKALVDAEVWRTAYFQALGRDEPPIECPNGCSGSVNLRITGPSRGVLQCVACGERWT